MRKIIGSLSALLAGVLLAGSAYATAVYRGAFDPPFYQGTATFALADNCVNTAPGENLMFPDDTCGSVDFLTAVVTHDGDPSNAIHFDAVQLDVVRVLRWIDGVLVGLDTDPVAFGFNPIGPQTSIDGTFFTTDPNLPQYFLQFRSGAVSDTEDVRLLASDPPATVTLFSCPDGFSTCNPVDAEHGPALQSPFVPVPEPGSLVLIAGGLLAGWAARRRRSH